MVGKDTDGEELEKLHVEIEAAADALYVKASEIHGLARRLEELTKDTPARYPGMRARVEAGRPWSRPRNSGGRWGSWAGG